MIRRWNGVESDLRVHQIWIVGDYDGDWVLVELQDIICLQPNRAISGAGRVDRGGSTDDRREA